MVGVWQLGAKGVWGEDSSQQIGDTHSTSRLLLYYFAVHNAARAFAKYPWAPYLRPLAIFRM